MRIRALIATLFVAVGLLAFACGGKKPPPKEPTVTETVADAGDEDADAEPPAPKSLYERLGGKDGIAKVIDTFMKNVAADTKISKRFAKVKGDRLEKFKTNMVNMICVETGGPEAGSDCKYEGKDMKEAHKGMKIKEEEWDAMLLDLRNALEEEKVGETEIADLVAVLSGVKGDIVLEKKK